MPSTSFTYNSTTQTADVIDDHFGVNIIINDDSLAPPNPGEQSNYVAVEEKVVNNVI